MEQTISVLPAKARNFSAIADLLNHISDPVYIADSNNYIVFANDYFCELTKFNHTEILGKNESRFFRGKTELNNNKCINFVFNRKNDLNVDSLIDAEENLHTIIKLRNNFYHFDGEEYSIVSIKNGSDYDGINEYLLHDVEKFGEVNRAKDKFISAVSHDIRGPIGSIISSSDLLLDMFDKVDKEEVKKFLQSINRTAKKSFHLLEDLKLLTELRTGSINRKFSPESLSSILDDLVSEENFSSINILKHPKLKTDIIFGDKILLRKIFRTLFYLMTGSVEILIKDSYDNTIVNIKANKENVENFRTINRNVFGDESFNRNELSRNLENHLIKEVLNYHKALLEITEENENPILKISFPKPE